MSGKALDPKLAAILESIRATVGGAGNPPEPGGGEGADRASEKAQAVPAALPEPRAPVRSVEEFLADLIRPQVQAWLDRNLPELVQQLTAAEIEKLIGKR